MKEYTTDKIRNIAVVSHGGAGKTTMAEAMLYNTGVLTRLGRISEGNTAGDYMPDEIKRSMSLTSKLIAMEWKGVKINLIDTPGFVDFVGEAKKGIWAADSVILLINAINGVEGVTESVWGFIEEYGKPKAIFINRMDNERADFDMVLESIKKNLTQKIAPVIIPIGKESNFKGVADLLKGKAYIYKDDLGKSFDETEMPAELADAAETYKMELVEAIAETDDELINKYLEGQELTSEEINSGFRNGLKNGTLIPVFSGSAFQNRGIAPLMDYIAEVFPDPSSRGTVKGIDGTEKKIDDSESTSAFVYKLHLEQHVGEMAFFKVMSGKISTGQDLKNINSNAQERLNNLCTMQGKKKIDLPSLHAGDIGVTMKLKETKNFQTLVDPRSPVEYPPVELPPALLTMAIKPRSKGDQERLSTVLGRFLSEDPSLRTEFVPEFGESLIHCMGEIHLATVVEKLKENGVEIDIAKPRVPYRETVTKSVQYVEYTHKKQTGGSGQYGKVAIDLDPLPRGSGYEFADKIVGGVIDQVYRPAVDKGIQARMAEGIIASCPVVDIRVSLVDGKTHPVDSKDIAFQIAGREAIKKAFEQAKPILLEPIMKLKITVPEEDMGDVLGDINSRRGKVLGMEREGNKSVLQALVPEAELFKYINDLRSMTAGRGMYYKELDHYEEVPSNLASGIIAANQKNQEES